MTSGRSASSGHPNLFLEYLAWIAVLTPAFLGFLYVRLNGVDVPFWDQWELVPMIDRSRTGHLTFHDLWTQHNEHRIFVPRLLMIGLAHFSDWDVRWEMYASLAVLVATVAIVLRTELGGWKRPWPAVLAGLPVPIVMFSWRQWENFLWGWQLQFFLCIFFAISAFHALACYTAGRSAFVAALILAAASTFSLSAGFAVWPAGVLVLWIADSAGAQSKVRRALLWIGTGVICLVGYLWGYSRPQHHPTPEYILHNPRTGFEYLLVLLGSPFGEERGRALVCGTIFLAFALIAIVVIARNRSEPALAFPAGLISFSGLALLMITIGRAGFGDVQAQASRYVTIVGVLIVGVYFVLRRGPGNGSRLQSGIGAAFLGFVISGILSTQPASWDRARAWRAERLAQQRSLRCYQVEPVSNLAGIYFSADRVRELVPLLEKHRLSALRRACSNQ